ncbi:hypothetical protein KJ359_010460 [Pestalotiopsis sp. 9143b]|nr:hypothetical protein KJ359_010460 [Pestalotiopsis sp. 9143b]
MAASRQQEAQLTFAIEVTKQLQADASAVERHRVGGSFPGQLAGQAFSIQQSLRPLLRQTDGHQQQTERYLPQYLENIERLYQRKLVADTYSYQVCEPQ